MTPFFWGLALAIPCALAIWARVLDVHVPNRRYQITNADLKLKEDEDRYIEHHCPNCKASRSFLEVRLSGQTARMSCWIPDLRFCVACGIVMHIQKSRVPE